MHIERRRFLTAAAGILAIGGSAKPVKAWDGGDPPVTNTAPTKDNRRRRHYDQREFAGLSNAWIAKIIKEVKDKKSKFSVDGFSDRMAWLLLRAMDRDPKLRQKSRIRRWIRKMGNLKDKKSRRAYIKEELKKVSAELKRLNKNLRDLRRQARKAKGNDLSRIERVIAETQDLASGFELSRAVGTYWSFDISEGQK